MKILSLLVLCTSVLLIKGLRENSNSCCLATDHSNLISDHMDGFIKSVSVGVNKSVNISQRNINLNYRSSNDNVVSLDIKSSNYEQELLQTLSRKVFAIAEPFNPALSPLTSQTCKIHSKLFMNSLHKFDLWALKIYDASAKISSGILNGNVNHFGDFDQCVNAENPDNHFTGQYCLTYLQTSIPEHLPKLKYLNDLTQSHRAFKSEFYDPGHRVPRFNIINWAICVPSTCSPKDVEHTLKEYVQNFTSGTGIQTQIRVDPQMCQVKNVPLDRHTITVGIFFATIIAISLLSTLIDFKVENPNPWLVAFSLNKNIRSLISLKRNPSDIESLHGIRFLNAVLLLLAHKSMALFFDPYINRTEMTESLGQPWTVIGRAAAIYTDVFLLFSGLLTAYSIIGKLQKKKPLNLVQEYIGRFMRIVPTFGALILFCTFILPHLGSGPQWNLVIAQHATKCKKYWWRNLLFIHNYFGFEEMCLTHTHHLGIDTELFVVAPIMILILWKWPKKGGIFLLGLAALSTYGRFYVTVAYKLSNYVYFGQSIQRLFRTADYMYTIPVHRATIYILGIFLGYSLRMYKNYKLTETQLKIGWYVSWTLFIAVLFGPAPMGSISYVYNEYHAAVYAAFGPMAWCALFSWIVFTSHLGYESLLSKALSWKLFQITTRLSYAIYLTQFPVFFYNVGRRRHAAFYEFFSYSVNIHEYIWIGIASVALTLFFDCPFQNIKKIIFNNSSSTTSQQISLSNDKPDLVTNMLMSEDSKELKEKKL